MTCCAGVLDEGCVWLSSDQMVTRSTGGKLLNGVKIDQVLGCGIAVSGDPGFKQIVVKALYQYVDLDTEEAPVIIDADSFGDFLRETLHNMGWTPKLEDGDAPFWGVNLLLTDGRTLWCYDSSMFAYKVENYEVIGSGAMVGLSAASVLDTFGVSGKDMASGIVEAAIKTNVWCGGVPQTRAFTPSFYVNLQ